MVDWLAASHKAAKTAKWSVTMTRWLIARLKSKTAWNLVAFTGPQGGESVGIVDILAIRKDHKRGANGLKRGDVFEIIMFQVKGGSAAWPSWDEVTRLQKVGERYRAKAVVLAVWKKGRQPILYKLKDRADRTPDSKIAWEEIERPMELFG